MSRPSNIERQPPEIRERIDALLREKVPLDDIMAKLAELGAEGVSRSGLGRYKQSIDRVGEKMRQTRQLADALIAKLGDAPEGRQQRLLIEMMRSLVFDVLIAASEGTAEGSSLTLDAEQVMFLGRTLRDLAAAQKWDADLALRLRKELAEEAEAKLKKLESDGGKPGARAIDPDTLRRVREEIYGIRTEARP